VGLPDLAEARKKMLSPARANEALAEIKALPEGSPERLAKEEELIAKLRQTGKVTKEEVQPRREHIQFLQELGGLAGRIALAVALVLLANKRLLLWLFQVPALVIIPVVWFWVFPHYPEYFACGVFLAGACIVGQFSYFGEYLPKVFPVHLRGTGGAFATNVGGRMIGTAGAYLTTGVIAPLIAAGPSSTAFAAGVTGVLVFAVGFLASFFLPQPQQQEEKKG
ncbi:MAG TPA: MFS transporter, partial [Gemmataceae bacterium]|nr:MFS transporter [Gemmataceae bacterium]